MCVCVAIPSCGEVRAISLFGRSEDLQAQELAFAHVNYVLRRQAQGSLLFDCRSTVLESLDSEAGAMRSRSPHTKASRLDEGLSFLLTLTPTAHPVA